MISIQECPFPLFNSECEDICYHLLSWVLRWLLDFFQDFIFAFSGINGKESIAWSCPEPEFHWSVLNRGLLSIMAIMKCGEIKVNEKDLGLSLVKFLIKKTKQILIYHQRKAIFFFSRVSNHSVIVDSWQPYGLKPARLLCPWDFPG